MEPMQMAVGTHVPEPCHLGLRCHALSAAVSVAANVGIAVLIVAHLCGHGSDGGSEFLISASIVANFSFVCALPAVSVALAAPALASCWM